MRQYEEVQPMRRGDAEIALQSGDALTVNRALVSLAFFDPDWRWVQAQCIQLSRHSEPDIRSVSATCLGHLARIHGIVDRREVEAVLHRLMEDSEPSVRSEASDALDEVRLFLGRGESLDGAD